MQNISNQNNNKKGFGTILPESTSYNETEGQNQNRFVSVNVLDILTQKMVWQNLVSKTIFTIPASTTKTLKDLIVLLEEFTLKNNLTTDKSLLPKNRYQNGQMAKYLKGEKLTSVFQDWVLLNFPEKSLYNQKQVEFNLSQAQLKPKDRKPILKNKQVKQLLEKDGYTLYNLEIPNIKPITILPNQFSSSQDLFDTWVNHSQPLQVKSTKNIFKKFYTLITRRRTKAYYGWHIKPTSEFSPKIDRAVKKKTKDNFPGQSSKPLNVLKLNTNNHKEVELIKNLAFSDVITFFKLFYTKYFSSNTCDLFLNFILRQFSLNFQDNQFFETEGCKKIQNKTEMVDFLKTSPSLYHRICGWFLINPLDSNFVHDKLLNVQNHHIIPQYLIGHSTGSFTIKREAVLQPHNVISVPTILHLCLHTIRYIEFGLIQDAKAIYVTYAPGIPSNSQAKKNSTEIVNLLNIIKSYSHTNPKLNNYFQSNRLFSLYNHKCFCNLLKKGYSMAATISPERLNKWDFEMVWINKTYPIKSVIIPLTQVKSKQDLVLTLRQITKDRVPGIESTQPFSTNTITQLIKYLSTYLNQNSENARNSAFYGWCLKDFGAYPQNNVLTI